MTGTPLTNSSSGLLRQISRLISEHTAINTTNSASNDSVILQPRVNQAPNGPAVSALVLAIRKIKEEKQINQASPSTSIALSQIDIEANSLPNKDLVQKMFSLIAGENVELSREEIIKLLNNKTFAEPTMNFLYKGYTSLQNTEIGLSKGNMSKIGAAGTILQTSYNYLTNWLNPTDNLVINIIIGIAIMGALLLGLQLYMMKKGGPTPLSEFKNGIGSAFDIGNQLIDGNAPLSIIREGLQETFKVGSKIIHTGADLATRRFSTTSLPSHPSKNPIEQGSKSLKPPLAAATYSC